jgi:magnesium chelatase family protein
MLAKRLPTILPPLTLDEALETTKIHSIVGLLAPGQALVTRRPFRAPHHTASDAGLLGGNINPTPGEISSRTTAFCFWTNCRNSSAAFWKRMRQPLEEGRVTISRAAGTMTFPSQFMLVAAMNPTPDGKMPGESKVRRAKSKIISAAFPGRCSTGLIARRSAAGEVPRNFRRQNRRDFRPNPRACHRRAPAAASAVCAQTKNHLQRAAWAESELKEFARSTTRRRSCSKTR